jgi:hypothetical protein
MPNIPAPPSTPAAHLTHVICAYGGSGPAPPSHVAIVLLFDLAAVSDVNAPRLVNIEILDGSGAPVARASSPIGLRVAPPNRTNLDYSEFGTTPLGGPIPAGIRVRLRAAADLTPLQGAYSAALRYRASLTTEEGTAPLVLEGPLDNPWPTASPAPR